MKIERPKRWLIITIITLSFFATAIPILGVLVGVLLLIKMKKDNKIFDFLISQNQTLENTEKKIKQKQIDLENLNSKIKTNNNENEKAILEYNSNIYNLKSEIELLTYKIKAIKDDYTNYYDNFEEIKSYKDLEKILTTLQVGLYAKEYNFDISEEFRIELKSKQKEQAECIKNNQAIKQNLNNNILYNYSLKKSDYNKVINAIIKLSLRAFNNECDSVIAKVTSKNIVNSRKRIESSFDNINKLIDSFGLMISIDYFKLKINEVQLAYEYEVKKAEEREEQKQLKDQMREEAKVKSEIDKMEKEAKKETELYEKALKKATLELQNASIEEQNKLDLQIQSLKDKLKEAEEKMKRAKSMAEQTKAGHVYIISNIGSFGENIYKIGMTRRLDPTERVNELSSASVPFPFDIHATIQTDNAPALENELHKKFEKNKLNKINSRKEFFKISLNEIEQAVKELYGDFKITKHAEAYEYKQSLLETNVN